MVLLNALGLSSRDWAAQLSALVQSGQPVVAVDRRGHGDSPYRRTATFDDLVRDVQEVLDDVGAPQYELVGLSLGGTEALALADHDPERVSGLVLADTFASLTPNTAEQRMAGMVSSLDTLGMVGLAEKVVSGMVHRPLPPEQHHRAVDGLVHLGSDAFFDIMRALYAANLDTALGRLRVPVTVLSAEHDSRTPPNTMAALAQRIPTAALVTIPDAGHFPHLEQEAAVSAALLNHLDR